MFKSSTKYAAQLSKKTLPQFKFKFKFKRKPIQDQLRGEREWSGQSGEGPVGALSTRFPNDPRLLRCLLKYVKIYWQRFLNLHTIKWVKKCIKTKLSQISKIAIIRSRS